jgi:hypothetical protein
MNFDLPPTLTSLRQDITSWPAIRHRLLGGWSYVLTAIAFLAVAVPMLLSGLVTLLVNLGRLLVWLAGLLDSIGSYLQQARPTLEQTPHDDPALEPLARLVDSHEQAHRLSELIDSTDGLLVDAAVRASIESMQLVDDANPEIPIEGYVIAMPSSSVPDSPVPDSHVAASRPRTRKRSASGSKRTTPAGFNAGPARPAR